MHKDDGQSGSGKGAVSSAELTIHGLIDRLSERYSAGEHKLQAMRAREDYFERAGKVFDDDAELFDGRMASFLEWYVLERPAKTLGGATPVTHALADAREVILDWVEKAVERGVARDEILFHLSRNHIRWHRLGHTGAAKIYRDNG